MLFCRDGATRFQQRIGAQPDFNDSGEASLSLKMVSRWPWVQSVVATGFDLEGLESCPVHD
jgi:hypothetical protein